MTFVTSTKMKKDLLSCMIYVDLFKLIGVIINEIINHTQLLFSIHHPQVIKTKTSEAQRDLVT
jgi:hypothetical protein